MTRVRGCVAVALIAAAACRGEVKPAADAAFAIEMPPGEGIPVLEAVGDSIVLHAGPSSGTLPSRVLTGVQGRILSYDSTRYVTLVPGTLVAADSTTIVGYNHGAITALTRAAYYDAAGAVDSFAVAAGDTVEFLQHRAEGTCFVRRRDEVIDAEQCPAISPGWTTIRDPVTELWFRVAGGAAPGWVKIGDGSVRIARRTF